MFKLDLHLSCNFSTKPQILDKKNGCLTAWMSTIIFYKIFNNIFNKSQENPFDIKIRYIKKYSHHVVFLRAPFRNKPSKHVLKKNKSKIIATIKERVLKNKNKEKIIVLSDAYYKKFNYNLLKKKLRKVQIPSRAIMLYLWNLDWLYNSSRGCAKTKFLYKIKKLSLFSKKFKKKKITTLSNNIFKLIVMYGITIKLKQPCSPNNIRNLHNLEEKNNHEQSHSFFDIKKYQKFIYDTSNCLLKSSLPNYSQTYRIVISSVLESTFIKDF